MYSNARSVFRIVVPWCVFACLIGGVSVGTGQDVAVGRRPYEMDWAGRIEDTRPPTVDFESSEPWTIEVQDAVAAFSRSREQQLFGQYVGRLVYRGDGQQPRVTLRPPKPVPLPPDFDSVNLWCYGNNWAWVPDHSTPQVALTLLLRSAAGGTVRVSLGAVNWKEWWLIHRRLSTEQLDALGPGATWEGLEISGGRNQEDRLLLFDNLCFYREPLPPLTFEPRPSRGVELFPGQCSGTNTGPGQLPFPIRQETILPDNLTQDFTVRLTEDGGSYLFAYDGADGRLEYRYTPRTGTFSDVSAEWASAGRTARFQPMAGGGVLFDAGDARAAAVPDRIELLDCQRQGETVVSRWKCQWGEREAEVRYTFRLWQKSLVIDVACLGGLVQQLNFGSATGVDRPRLVTVPYLTGAEQRPAILVSGPPEHPLFMMGLVDHTRSNASELWFENAVEADRVTYNGGARYRPKTDGRRNDCFERLFLTISPRFEEVLPNVPNPKSPWMHVAGERVWRAHAASDRERDYALWQRVARHGMNKIALTDHETGWRDGGESFTFRTRAAPGKGGDAAQAEYARKIRALGFRYGIYNNYTDFAPVNEFWDEDLVTRLPDGQWRTAWPRCYNPKPARAVEFEARLAPIIQQKFQLDTAYCDVHTAVQPWSYCDFDARVPGAGTFAATFYAYGEIMLHQKATWNGPVYSEGNHHWYYCGLTDGNYAQDQSARLAENPWLVDFDLLKLHPLCCNFGMGNLEMFFGRREGLGDSPEQRAARLDQFLAATLAFGHTGFLVMEGGMDNAIRSYFSLQQLHARYAQARAAEIRYADAEGRLWDTSAAVASDAYRRSQVATRYDNGVRVIVNGHPTQAWTTDDAVLPPFGWWVRDDSRGDLLGFSALVDGHRADYVDSPAYLYADPRGRFVRFDRLACDGPLIVLRGEDAVVEVIPVAPCAQFGVSLEGAAASAVALNESGDAIGPASTRLSRGLVFVEPVAGAFSYRLTPQGPSERSLRSERCQVVPGEVVTVLGREPHSFRVPVDATVGTLLWQSFEDQWIDFLVKPLVDTQLEVADHFRLEMISHAPQAGTAEIEFDGQSRTAELAVGTPVKLEFPYSPPTEEMVRPLTLNVRLDRLAMQRRCWLKWEEATRVFSEFAAESRCGQRLRGGDETGLAADSGAQAYWNEMSCGGVTKPGLFMHPPYRGGVGYAFAEFDPVDLPEDVPAEFRCEIGKRDGSDPGDGILFRVAIVDDDGAESVLAERQWIEHAWSPWTVGLSSWAGQRVRIKLIADVGEEDNSSGDWACWSGMRIQSARPVLTASLHDRPVSLRFEPGPYPPPELTVELLRSAMRGAIHYEGIGLESGEPYVSHAVLDGVPLGPLPAAGGSEREGIWSSASLPLTPAAIARLALENTLTIDNRGRDYFKIRRVWIELELADGQKWSSQVNTTVFTQPTDWPYAEGVRVPFSESISVPLRWRAKE